MGEGRERSDAYGALAAEGGDPRRVVLCDHVESGTQLVEKHHVGLDAVDRIQASCFGDSGGPAFLGQYVVGDSSFVNSLSCNATAGYQRVDTPYARAFLEQFI